MPLKDHSRLISYLSLVACYREEKKYSQDQKKILNTKQNLDINSAILGCLAIAGAVVAKWQALWRHFRGRGHSSPSLAGKGTGLAMGLLASGLAILQVQKRVPSCWPASPAQRSASSRDGHCWSYPTQVENAQR